MKRLLVFLWVWCVGVGLLQASREGVYSGLVGERTVGTGGAAERQAFLAGNGYLEVNSALSGAFSGIIRWEGRSQGFAGKWDDLGNATVSVTREGGSAMSVVLRHQAVGFGEVNGSVESGGQSVKFVLKRADAWTGGGDHPLGGRRYTVLLAAPKGQGVGYGMGSLSIGKTGRWTLSGCLGNGQGLTTFGRVVDGGTGSWVLPVYAGGQSVVSGQVEVWKEDRAAGSDVGGSLVWLKNVEGGVPAGKCLKELEVAGTLHGQEGETMKTGLGGAAFTLEFGAGLGGLSAAVKQEGTWPWEGSPVFGAGALGGISVRYQGGLGRFDGRFESGTGALKVGADYRGVLLSRKVTLADGRELRGGGYYAGGLGGGALDLTSEAAAVERPVVKKPEIVRQPEGGEVVEGGKEWVLSVEASGKGILTYEWRKDGVKISGASEASYPAREAGIYVVVVSNAGGSVTSSAAVVKRGLVYVEGGTLPTGSRIAGTVVQSFQIGKTEVRWDEWKAVRDWAVTKGYDLAGVGEGSGEDHPARNINWYDAVKWCNARSEKEGLGVVYRAHGGVYRTGVPAAAEITMSAVATGYRLPLEAEWEWAARGGVQSKGYVYSGGNSLVAVGWYYDDANGAVVNLSGGRGTWPVAKKLANELGLYDMSGNVWEWCWEAYGSYRRTRGGAWSGDAAYTPVAYQYSGPYWNSQLSPPSASTRGWDQGLRVCRGGGSAGRPVISEQPLGGELPVSGVVVVGVAVEGRAAVAYQWRRDGVSIYGASEAQYAAKVPGKYTVVVSTADGTVISSEAEVRAGLVAVEGGAFFGAEVASFEMGRYEVRWDEWKAVRDWAVGKGYDLGGIGAGSGEDHPVRNVSWYEALKWCNARSEKEGLGVVYLTAGAVYRSGRPDAAAITLVGGASGYRLPLEVEWEWAVRGGVKSKGYFYSGGNDLSTLGWYEANSAGASVNLSGGKGTWAVGKKVPNELGLYDMSGNVEEWCWDAYSVESAAVRKMRGGNWGADELSAQVATGGGRYAAEAGSLTGGFRVVRSAMLLAVEGGTLPAGSGLAGTVVKDFRIGKYEVRWDEWKVVRDWAVTRGYDLGTVGEGSGVDHPVRNISWYDALKWCNARSEKEGLGVVYNAHGGVYRSGQPAADAITTSAGASGYRLPLEAEWEWAARGGVKSRGYGYSGGNDVNAVAWTYDNASGASVNLGSGRGTWPVGKKAGNELGLYDMSGNLWEWCWELFPSGTSLRRLRGSDWSNLSNVATVSYRSANYEQSGRCHYIGFRVACGAGR